MIKFKNNKKDYIEVIPIEYNIYEFLHNMRNSSISIYEIAKCSKDKETHKFIKQHSVLNIIINGKHVEKKTVLNLTNICEISEIEKFTHVKDKPLYFFKATFLHEEYDAIYLTYDNIYDLFNLTE